MSKRVERGVGFLPKFREDLVWFIKNDRKLALRVADPFGGIGKPEPLRHEFAGCWSRRITQEHRLVYRVTADRIDFLQARYHYE